MRILWHSATPMCNTGYGVITKEIIPRLKAAGHFVRVGTKHADQRWHEWNGFEVFEGVDTQIVIQMLEDEAFDYIITCWDIWQMYQKRPYPKEKWVAWVPIDTEWMSKDLIEVTKQAGVVAGMSKHGMRELAANGFADATYIPLGVDTNVFRLKAEGGKAFRDSFGWAGNFVIGTVGLNYPNDRKGFIPLMRAFREFHKRHDEARLFIHSFANYRGDYEGSINYHEIVADLGIDKITAWPDQGELVLGRINNETLCDIYNGFDVFCLATRGEGFGLPILEAQACGVPVCVSNTTTGAELCFCGELIAVNELDDAMFSLNRTWRLDCRPSAILEALEKVYDKWLNGGLKEQAEKATAKVLEYSWDNVWQTYWVPFLAMLEARLTKKALAEEATANNEFYAKEGLL